jgi:hypothetical protein
VETSGSIDWLCFLYFVSPNILAAVRANDRDVAFVTDTGPVTAGDFPHFNIPHPIGPLSPGERSRMTANADVHMAALAGCHMAQGKKAIAPGGFVPRK